MAKQLTTSGHRCLFFVGERRSKKAIRLNVTWEHGKLAACTLFKALLSCGIDPTKCYYRNLWYDHADGKELDPNTVRFARTSSIPVVSLGNKVAKELTRLGIKHVKMVHPAARGKIRTTRNYQKHVKEVLHQWLYA